MSVTRPLTRSTMHGVLRTGWGAVLMFGIMVTGSIVLWIGAPLAWLWVAAQIQGRTQSLGTALGVGFVGVVTTVLVLGSLLSRLSDGYRFNRMARGHEDPGHGVLEGVLVVCAGIALAVFAVWFLLFAGADPAPIGIAM